MVDVVKPLKTLRKLLLTQMGMGSVFAISYT